MYVSLKLCGSWGYELRFVYGVKDLHWKCKYNCPFLPYELHVTVLDYCCFQDNHLTIWKLYHLQCLRTRRYLQKFLSCNSVDPGETLTFMASDPGVHHLPVICRSERNNFVELVLLTNIIREITRIQTRFACIFFLFDIFLGGLCMIRDIVNVRIPEHRRVF